MLLALSSVFAIGLLYVTSSWLASCSVLCSATGFDVCRDSGHGSRATMLAFVSGSMPYVRGLLFT